MSGDSVKIKRCWENGAKLSLPKYIAGLPVTGVGEGAFSACTGLYTVYFDGTEAEWSNITVEGGNSPLFLAEIVFELDLSSESGITVSTNTATVPKDAVPSVNTVENGNIAISPIPGYDIENAIVYDISLLLNGVKIQPDGAITVCIPVSEGVNGNRYTVFFVDDEGNATPHRTGVENGCFVFETDHFSYYAVIERSLDFDGRIGDLDNDGDVNSVDSNLMKRYLAGVYEILIPESADINGDKDTNSIDSNLIRRYLAGVYEI